MRKEIGYTERNRDLRSNRKRGFKTSELSESPFEERKRNAKSTSEHKCTHVSLDEYDVHILVWMKKISIDETFSLLSNTKKNISHLLLKLLKYTPIPSLRNVRIQRTFLLSIYFCSEIPEIFLFVLEIEFVF